MKLKEKIITAQLEILGKAIEREERVAHLYEAFASHFPSQTDFWDGLARIEHVHATMLRQMKRHIEQHGDFLWNIGRLKHDDLEEEQMIAAVMQDLADGRLDFASALKTAALIEKSTFHAKFYDVVNCELPYFQETAKGLRRAEKKHIGRLEENITLHAFA